MASWAEFAAAEPEMADRGRALIYQYGVGLGFLATVGADGMPRLHPVCPLVTNGGLWVFVVPSPKRGDLARDGRYALHAFTPEEVDDEFMVAGHARRVVDPAARAAAVAAYHLPVPDEHELYELDVERALLATYARRGEWPPVYRRWRSPALPAASTKGAKT